MLGTHRQQRRQRGLARPRRPRDENVRPDPPPSIPSSSSAAVGGGIVAAAFRAHGVVVGERGCLFLENGWIS
jgi:hypothetical protein